MHDHFGAFIKKEDIKIPGAVTGPLGGLTFAAKDDFEIKGHVTGAGNPDWCVFADSVKMLKAPVGSERSCRSPKLWTTSFS